MLLHQFATIECDTWFWFVECIAWTSHNYFFICERRSRASI